MSRGRISKAEKVAEETACRWYEEAEREGTWRGWRDCYLKAWGAEVAYQSMGAGPAELIMSAMFELSMGRSSGASLS